MATAAMLTVGALAMVAPPGAPTVAGASAAASAVVNATAEPYSCAPNGPAGGQTVYGTFGDASVLRWTGHSQSVVACLPGSLVAQRSDGTLVVGRGVPDSWVRTGRVIKLANFPASAGRRIGLMVSTRGTSVTLSLSGARPAGAILFQLPAFVHNIAGASTGTVSQKTGTVTLAPGVRRVTVHLRHGEHG